MITIFTKNNCPLCIFTKRKLNELGIKYIERNIDDEPEVIEYLTLCGAHSVPVVFKDGEILIVGRYAPNILETCVSEEDSEAISDEKMGN